MRLINRVKYIADDHAEVSLNGVHTVLRPDDFGDKVFAYAVVGAVADAKKNGNTLSFIHAARDGDAVLYPRKKNGAGRTLTDTAVVEAARRHFGKELTRQDAAELLTDEVRASRDFEVALATVRHERRLAKIQAKHEAVPF